jgi:uncharacterized phage protein gp47/JayE
MTTYGVTATGFVKKPQPVCLEELQTEWKLAFGDEVDVSPNSPDGIILGVLSEREAKLWEHMEEVYLARYPDSAEGASLVDVCAITGTTPDDPTPSEVTATCTGTAGTILNIGRVFRVQNGGARFVTIESATLAALTAWAATTAYIVGDRRSNGGNSYICITAGTSAGSGGPTTTSSDITDGTVHWRYLGAGTAAADVDCESEDTGPKVANAFTLTEIVTAVGGLSNVTNLLDATLGEATENDPELRLKREQELRVAGNSATEAIRQDLLELDGVEDCVVYENYTETTDGDGRPMKSFEAVILSDGADQQEILDTIWAGKPAGIRPHGSVSGTVVDSSGNNQTVKYSTADQELAWITYNVTKKSTATATNAEIQAAVKSAVVDWATETGRYGLGTDLITAKLDAPIWADEDLESQLEDVTSITTVLKDTTPTGGEYSAANKTVSAVQIVRFDTSRITVNVS